MKAYRTLVLLAALALAGGGCASPFPSQVTVSLDKSWLYRVETLPSIEVNLVGVGAAETHLWETYSMTKYWRPGDRLRAETDKAVLQFGAGRPLSQTLKSSDPIWERWREAGITTIFILADLPGLYSDLPGDADPRRSVLPVKTTAPNIEVIILPQK